jgi:hypothetical protein
MEKPQLSIVFDSSIQFLDGDKFNEVVMAQVELFENEEFDSICNEFMSWDIKSLRDMQTSMFRFLMLRDGKELKLATNIVLDHCMEQDGKTDDFKVYLLTNTIEYIVKTKEFDAMNAQQQFSSEEGME